MFLNGQGPIKLVGEECNFCAPRMYLINASQSMRAIEISTSLHYPQRFPTKPSQLPSLFHAQTHTSSILSNEMASSAIVVPVGPV